jgi:hypothetical protein
MQLLDLLQCCQPLLLCCCHLDLLHRLAGVFAETTEITGCLRLRLPEARLSTVQATVRSSSSTDDGAATIVQDCFRNDSTRQHGVFINVFARLSSTPDQLCLVPDGQ